MSNERKILPISLLPKTHLADVDASSLLALNVTSAQLGDDRDGVETCILGEGEGDDLERLSKLADAVRVHALERVGVLGELVGHLDLGCATTGNEGATDDGNKERNR